jgi:hypothetical protein
MTRDAFEILAATPPHSLKEKMQARADISARIAVLESQLGLPHSPHRLKDARALARLHELEALAAKAGTPPTVLAPTAAAPTLPTATDALTVGLTAFLRMAPDTRAQFARDGGRLSKGDFDRLTAASKSEFCRNGGRIQADDDGVGEDFRCTAAKAFRNS